MKYLRWLPLLGCAAPMAWGAVASSGFNAALDVESFVADNDSLSLGGSQNGTLAGLNLKPQLGWKGASSWQIYFEGQLFAANNESDVEFDSDQGSSTEFANLRELWIGHQGFSDYPGDTLRLGVERQRWQDGFIFDSSLLGASWQLDTSLLKLQLGYGEQQDDLRTDDYFLPKEVEKLSLSYANARWQYGYGHAISSYYLYGEGEENPLDTQLQWAGIGLENGYYSNSVSAFSYSAFFHAVQGTQFYAPTNRLEDISGTAVDVGARWQFDVSWQPTIGLQYVAADAGAEGYRPTGFESNRAKFTGTRSSLYRLNEAIRADLRNLEVASVYLALAQYRQWDFNLVLSDFSLDDVRESYYLNGKPHMLVGDDAHLGRGLDLVFSGYLNRKGPGLFSLGYFDSVIRLRLSAFDYDTRQQANNPELENLNTQYAGMLSWIVNL
ncbi:hypothetical protein D0C16_10985 [Cellvibrio sp. KY-GH-1]|uniref:alginate export family protein n=1 Tax=Cellvibrio sp. KY-GH-1 TaxID=2303332 RepID=UPI001243DA6E|nr:alginate export family protein [Cellvibrio sp. KY-GH-1]QEY16459.1 hypothetical protein D0C16_10985 [Cellvibrio sp. KY-GH-1]